MILTPLQERVLGVLVDVAERNGFAMGGSVALQALGIVVRPTEDFDMYSTSMDPDVYAKVEQDLTNALGAIGLKTSITKTMDWFRCVLVEDTESGELVRVDLGLMSRTRPISRHPQVGGVLDIEDLRASKVDALVTRRAPRDYIDTYNIVKTGAWTIDEIDEYVARFRPEVSRDEWKQTLDSMATIPPGDFAEYNIDAIELAEMTEFFIAWAGMIPPSTPTVETPMIDVEFDLDIPLPTSPDVTKSPSTSNSLGEAAAQRLASGKRRGGE